MPDEDFVGLVPLAVGLEEFPVLVRQDDLPPRRCPLRCGAAGLTPLSGAGP